MADVRDINDVLAADRNANRPVREDSGTAVEEGMLSRVIRRVGVTIHGVVTSWFGPMQPLPPVAQKPKDEAIGRQLDYPVGINQIVQPRSGELASFAALRSLADSYDLLRLVIETRKDELVKMKWDIRLRETAKPKAGAKPANKKPPAEKIGEPLEAEDAGEAVEDPRLQELRDFLAFPDKEHDYPTWLRAVLEDMLVIDAATVYPRMDRGGRPYALELMDGALICRKIDSTGRTPLPPEPAYQQVLKGVPAVDYHRDELIYRPRNVRTWKLYGLSPVEQIVMTVNIALRRQVSQLSYYTEGNVPEALLGVPDNWTPEQIKQFQQYWDSLLAGNLKMRRRGMFVPGAVSKNSVFTKEGMLKDEYDEWLARIVAYAFSVSAQPLLKQINKGEADTQKEIALEGGLMPMMMWVKSLMDLIIWKYFGYQDIEFAWEEEESMDPLVAAQTYDLYIKSEVMHPQEVRERLNMGPMSPELQAEIEAKRQMAEDIAAGEGEEDGDDNAPPVGKVRKVKKKFGRSSAHVCASGPHDPAQRARLKVY